MPKTRINCPNCRQPIAADIEQLFDVGQNPSAKQQFLSGMFNIAQCPHCGFQGNLATPLVYHDPQKELLLTYFPAELGLPVNEQERIIGPLITRVMNSLPQEQRKAYLFRPQTMFTLQSMIERVLEADGITKEMIEAQQQRLALIQQLMGASDEEIAEIAAREDAAIDSDFYSILNRLMQTALVSGDETSARRLNELQQKLMPITTFGRKIAEQSKEVEAAIQNLQNAGKNLTQEKLLDLVIQAPNEIQLSVIVSMARPGMDYTFFQMLSERLDRSTGEERERLIKRREQLLEMTQAIDKQAEERSLRARQLLNALLQAADTREATIQNLPAIDEFLLHVFDEEMEIARKKGDLDRISRLKQIQEVIEEASAPPPELALIEELLDSPDDDSLLRSIEARRDEITPEFMEMLTGLAARPQEGQDPQITERIQALYKAVLRLSMQGKMG
ncbi:MAG: CpXC domain-containing protein [Anaerolineales bacterium]|nr:CpXC domain-containing protein [Anaerolineales bacterium]